MGVWLSFKTVTVFSPTGLTRRTGTSKPKVRPLNVTGQMTKHLNQSKVTIGESELISKQRGPIFASSSTKQPQSGQCRRTKNEPSTLRDVQTTRGGKENVKICQNAKAINFPQVVRFFAGGKRGGEERRGEVPPTVLNIEPKGAEERNRPEPMRTREGLRKGEGRMRPKEQKKHRGRECSRAEVKIRMSGNGENAKERKSSFEKTTAPGESTAEFQTAETTFQGSASMHSVFGLLASIVWAVIVTHFLCVKELFHFFVYRKQKSVKGKVIVVTGSGHGLGRRIARDFARLGATVVCWDIDKERNENTIWDIKNTNGKAVSVTCDVTDRTQVYQTAETIRKEVGEIDIVVSCVGIYPVKDVLSWKPQELYELFDTNVMAQIWVLQAFIPQMIKRKSGHFVTISSAAAIAPVGNEVPYSMTKSAVTCLMDGFMQELRHQNQDGIKITCVHPYYTACRDDIPVEFDLRFERQCPDFVSKEIIKGILQECEIISVPRFMLFWIHFMKLLPCKARRRWRDIFYTRVRPTDNSANLYTPDGKLKNIVDQFKLPPLNQGGINKGKTEGLTSVKVEPAADGKPADKPTSSKDTTVRL